MRDNPISHSGYGYPGYRYLLPPSKKGMADLNLSTFISPDNGYDMSPFHRPEPEECRAYTVENGYTST